MNNQTKFDGEKQNKNLTVVEGNATHFSKEPVDYNTTAVSFANGTSYDEQQQGKTCTCTVRNALCCAQGFKTKIPILIATTLLHHLLVAN